MRVSINMMSRNLLRNLQNAQERMFDLQNQMASGLKVSRPSDDPVAIESALRVKSGITRVEQWKKNASEALAYMQSMDTNLADIGSVLTRLKELALQGANSPVGVEDKRKIAMEVNQLMDQLRVNANAQIGTKYIYSGTRTDRPPLPEKLELDPDYSHVGDSQPYAPPTTWAGNDQEVVYEIGNGVRLPIFVSGKEVFDVQPDPDDNTKVKIGLFETVNKLSAALNDGDMDKLQEVIAELDVHFERVLGCRAELGARMNRLESLTNQLDSTSYNLTEDLSRLIYVDMAEAIIQFRNQENVYRAALAVGAQIIQPSLVDFMR